MDELDLFYARLNDLTARLTHLRHNGHDADEESEGWRHASSLAIEESLEELRVAGEEIHQQDNELQDALVAVEIERQANWELFDLAPEGYVVTNPLGMIRFANQTAVAQLARPGRALKGVPLANFLVEEQRRAFRTCLNRLIDQGRVSGLEFRLRPRGEGQPFDAALSAMVVRDRTGRATSISWLIVNVTEHRRAEEQEREGLRTRAATADAELARYRNLLEGIDTVVWEANPDGRLIYINRRVEEALGYSAARWLDEPGLWAERVHPEDREWAREQRERAFHADREYELEYRMIAADGRVQWFRESIRPQRDAEGRVSTVRGTRWNISRRKKIERRLYITKREIAANLADLSYLHELGGKLAAIPELRPLLAEVLDGVLAVLGAELGIIRLCNTQSGELETVASVGMPDAYLERYGRVRPGTDTCGLTAANGEPTVVEDVEADPAYAASREAARLGGFRAAYSVPLHSRTGELLGTVAACFYEPHRPPARQIQLAGLFARQAADLVQNARLFDDVRRAERAKDDFTALLAHELRNPLAAIVNTTYALDPEQSDADTIAEARQVIWRQTLHMSRLITELLEAARAQRGELILRKRVIDLAEVVKLALETTRAQLDLRRHTLEMQLPDAPCTLDADPDRLRQLVENLLGNAAKYTKPGGRVWLTVECGADEIVLHVRDTGIGIAPDLLGRIFEPYMQADPTPGRSQGGLGIGLALAKSIVVNHGGQICAESAGVGQGSVFTVRLPRGVVTQPEPAQGTADLPAPPRPNATATHQPRRIVVVDDNADAARTLARILTLWGHTARVANDGPEALALARSFQPEIALVDIGMPGMDGYEVAHRMREEIEPCVLIALTGYGRDDDRRRALEAGFSYHLVKPADPDELQKLLEQIGQAAQRAAEVAHVPGTSRGIAAT